MEPITDCGINLFADTLPSMDELNKLSDFAHSSESNLINFSQQVEANISRTSARSVLAVGIGLYIMGKSADAAEKLKKGNDCKEKFFYLAIALRRMGKNDEAIESLKKSLNHGADALSIRLETAATYREARNIDAAEKELKKCANFENVSADYHYQLGYLQESEGIYDQAMENYEKALDLFPNHQKAMFRLAFRCDLTGDEEAAIDYYKLISSTGSVHLNSLLNLAVLYEDKGQFDKAFQCVEKVLKYHPNHKRAILFKKDIESSKTMFFDEEKENKKTKKTQILETPISDFELSVRSRNCLRKMNIQTIGDLLNITETELLSYKNFGETSLREIKVILESKMLHLGMSLEERPPAVSIISESEQDSPNSVEEAENEAMYGKPIDDLQLSVRARKCVEKLNIRTIGELVHKTEAELLGCKNFGVTSLNEIKKTLTNIGLSLRNLD